MTTQPHDGAEHHAAHAVEHKKTGNTMAIFAYLWILILIPMLTDAKNDPFVKYHLKQGLALLLLEVVGWVVSWIPVLGWFVGWIISLVALVLAIIGIINVVNGQEKELPLVGQYGKSFTI